MNISKILFKLFLLSIVTVPYSARAQPLAEYLTFQGQAYDGMAPFVNSDFLPDPGGKCTVSNQSISYSLSVSLKNNSEQGYHLYAVPGVNFNSGVETPLSNFSVANGILTIRGLSSKVQYGFILQSPSGQRNRIFGMADICALTSRPVKMELSTRTIEITISRYGHEPVDHVTGGYDDNTPSSTGGSSGDTAVDPNLSFPRDGRVGYFHDGYFPREVYDLVISMLLTSYPRSAVGIMEDATTYSFQSQNSYFINFRGSKGEGYIVIGKGSQGKLLESQGAINVYGSDIVSIHLYSFDPATNKAEVEVYQHKKDGSYVTVLDFDVSGGNPRAGSLSGIDYSMDLDRDSDRFQDSSEGYRPAYGSDPVERVREIVNSGRNRRTLGYEGDGTLAFHSIKEIENNECEVRLSWELPGNTEDLSVQLLVDGVNKGAVVLMSKESGYLMSQCKYLGFYPQSGRSYSVKVVLTVGNLPILISDVKGLHMQTHLEQTSRRFFALPSEQPYRANKNSSVLMKKSGGGICNVRSGATGVKTSASVHQFLEDHAYLVGGIGDCWL